MTENNLIFIPKNQIPPAAPQIRPIGQFWAILKQKIYEGNWSAQNRNQLISRNKNVQERWTHRSSQICLEP